jgi:hypothetical protein
MAQGLVCRAEPAAGTRPVVWQDAAACGGAARELFFAPLIKEGRWRAFCSGCPVADVCFWSAMVEEEADDTGYRFGVRGGAPPSVRRKVAAVTHPGYARGRLEQALDAWRRSGSDDEAAAVPPAAGERAVGF